MPPPPPLMTATCPVRSGPGLSAGLSMSRAPVYRNVAPASVAASGLGLMSAKQLIMVAKLLRLCILRDLWLAAPRGLSADRPARGRRLERAGALNHPTAPLL